MQQSVTCLIICSNYTIFTIFTRRQQYLFEDIAEKCYRKHERQYRLLSCSKSWSTFSSLCWTILLWHTYCIIRLIPSNLIDCGLRFFMQDSSGSEGKTTSSSAIRCDADSIWTQFFWLLSRCEREHKNRLWHPDLLTNTTYIPHNLISSRACEDAGSRVC